MAESTTDADIDLAIGAAAIAQKAFNGQLSNRQVYRLAERGDWPIFKIQGKWTARCSSMRAEIARRETRTVTSGK